MCLRFALVFLGIMVVPASLQAAPRGRAVPESRGAVRSASVMESLGRLAKRIELGRGSQAVHRRDLARIGRDLRALRAHAPNVALREYRRLSVRLFEQRHRTTRALVRQMDRVEEGLRAGGELGALRAELARVGRAFPRGRTEGSGPLRDRYDRAVAELTYARLMADPRREGGTTAVEVETELTAGLLQMMRVRGGDRIKPLLTTRLVLPSTLSPEARAQRESQRADALKIYSEMSGGRHWVDATHEEQEALRTLQRIEIEDRYEAALTAVKSYAQRRGVPVARLTWREVGRRLGGKVQRDLLVGSVARQGSFLEHREIDAMEFAPGRQPVRIRIPVTLDGQRYERGTRRLARQFLSHVEFDSPNSAEYLSGIEAQRVRHGPAGTNSTEAFDLVWSVGSEMTHQHVHIPFRVRRSALEAPMGAMMLADHWRRANLFGELLAASQEGVLRTLARGGMTYFDYSSANGVERLYDHLAYREELAPSTLKMGAVGYRVGLYHNRAGRLDPGIEGYEARAVNVEEAGAESPPERAIRERWLNAMQRSLATGHYGIGRSAFREWHGRRVSARREEGRVLASLHYRRELPFLFGNPPEHVRSALSPELRAQLRDSAEINYGLRMLLHDWRRDTIWLSLPSSSRAAALERVQSAQVNALSRLSAGQTENDALRGFVRESGLLLVTARSLGF